MKAVSVNIPDDVKAAMKANGHRIGMTILIAQDELRVTLCAKDPATGALPASTASQPIDATVRKRLLASRLSLLARGGRQRITPFFDDGRRPAPRIIP